MNKSIEYIKKRISNSTDDIGGLPLTGWDDAKVINPMNILKKHIPIKNNRINYELFIDDDRQMEVIMEYDDEADYDYFTSKVITHDGTLLLQSQTINEILNKFFNLRTCSKRIATEDFKNNPFNYDIKYILGDILINSNYGIKEINEKKMSGQTDNIVLPVKFEIFKH